MSKAKYRVKNWKEYNDALKRRGSLTVWIEEGFVNSLFKLLQVNLKVPEFSRLSRRVSEYLKNLEYPAPEEIGHLVIDSSRIKVYGEKEWINTQKRKPYERRVWRKLHIAIDGTGVIRASQMTSHKVNDRACFLP